MVGNPVKYGQVSDLCLLRDKKDHPDYPIEEEWRGRVAAAPEGGREGRSALQQAVALPSEVGRGPNLIQDRIRASRRDPRLAAVRCRRGIGRRGLSDRHHLVVLLASC